MKSPHTWNILRRAIVYPYYRKNAGQFIVVFILFIGAVGELEGSQIHTGPWYQLHYQYQLISGLLQTRSLFLLVLIAWLLYAEKCARFVLSALRQPDGGFFYLLNRFSPRRLLGVMFRVQLLLFLPILVYLAAIFGVAIYQHNYVRPLLILYFVTAVCLLSAARSVYQLRNPGKCAWTLRIPSIGQSAAYWQFLWRHLLRHQSYLAIGIKIFSCGMLVVAVRTIRDSYYDLRMPAMLFGIGILGHAILVHQIRAMEERLLVFYRSMPVRLTARFFQYARFYLMLYIPEILTLAILTPGLLHGWDALAFLLAGYGLLLLMNSISFSAPLAIGDLLKIVLLLYGFLYLAVLGDLLVWLAVVSILAAVFIFRFSYYRYDPAGGTSS